MSFTRRTRGGPYATNRSWRPRRLGNRTPIDDPFPGLLNPICFFAYFLTLCHFSRPATPLSASGGLYR